MSELVPGKYGGKMNRWSKGESGNPKGRPKKLVPSMKVEGYKLTEINDTIQAIVSMTTDELQFVIDNPKSTILEKTVANALRRSLKEGNLESVETLINRVYGKPKEKVELDHKQVMINIKLDNTDERS